MRKVFSAALIVLVAATSCNKTKDKQSRFELNDQTSVAEWKGATPDHFHVGNFQVKGSMLVAADNSIHSGNFVIPISSITDFDLPEEIKPQLLNHLKSADFFNMALHPDAKFEITKIEAYTTPKEGAVEGANKLVTGNFTMVGQTHPITFPAKIVMVQDSLKVESKLKIDRTKWGMTKYSDAAAPDYIIPNADIHLKLAAAKK